MAALNMTQGRRTTATTKTLLQALAQGKKHDEKYRMIDGKGFQKFPARPKTDRSLVVAVCN